MKALTLYQPYATLLVSTMKTVETRSWGTAHRGLVAIHAARKWDEDAADDWMQAREDLKKCWGVGLRLPPAMLDALCRPVGETLGCILGVGLLEDCRPMLQAPDREEEMFGAFGPGRWGWVFPPQHMRPLAEPIPCRGQRMLWTVPPDVLARIEEQMEADSACSSTRRRAR